MSKTAVKKAACGECGADIRDEALFCYNCGEAVAASNDDRKDDGVSDAWFREEIAVEEIFAEEPEFDEPIAKPNESLASEANKADEEINETVKAPKAHETLQKPSKLNNKAKDRIKPKLPLKSAASLRNKPKLARRRKEEVIWQGRNQSPNIWFMVTSLLITILAGLLFLLAMYFK